MNEILMHLDKLNWPTIVSMFAIGWYFTREISRDLRKLENDVRMQGSRTDKLYEMFVDLLKAGKK